MTFQKIETACSREGLAIFGGFHPTPDDSAPEGCKTLLMLGPQEPGFWARLTSSLEFAQPDPVDRWSERVIGALAQELGATAVFPFGGPPYQPFISWALRTGRAWQSPVSLFVHDTAGLFLSFRGALAFDHVLELPKPAQGIPCGTCHQPCATACPADALTTDGYDVAACHKWLDTPSGKSCLNEGCVARRSCPVSQSYGRLSEQSAHHMRSFHKGIP